MKVKDNIVVTVGEHPIQGDEAALVKHYNYPYLKVAPLVQVGTFDVILQTLALISDPDCDIAVQMYDVKYSDADNRHHLPAYRAAEEFYIS